IGLFLIAPPYWSGDEDWKQGIKLHDDFADAIPKDIPIFIYQCLDDEEVPFDHFTTYQQHLPWATFREVESGGHQFNNDLTLVAHDIKSLSSASHSGKLFPRIVYPIYERRTRFL